MTLPVCLGGKGSIEILEMELSSFSSTRKFAEGFLSRGNALDILILNAGPIAAMQ